MNDTALTELEARLQRVERQNRMLIALLCAAIGIGAVAATRGGVKVISADEVRTHRITLLDERNAEVHRWWGAKGAMNE